MRFTAYVFCGLYISFALGCGSGGVKKALLLQTFFEKEDVALSELTTSECGAVKEFIVVNEFLKQQSYYKKQVAMQLSERASKGCKGAAARFIKVTEMLVKSGLYTPDALEVGVEAALGSDEQTETFVVVFQKSFLKEYLDLDLVSSLAVAKDLSFQWQGSSKVAKEDFESFVEFCLSSEGLTRSKPECAQWSHRLTQTAQAAKAGSRFEQFKKGFDFITAKEGLEQSPHIAVEWSENLLKKGQGAVDDFILAYKYALKESGLELTPKDAVQFAFKLGNHPERQPAQSEASTKKSTP